MDALYVILIVVVIGLLISNQNRLLSRIDLLEHSILDLNSLIKKLKEPAQPTVIQQKPAEEPLPKPVADKPKPVIPEIKKPYVPEPPKPAHVEWHAEVINDPAAPLRKPQVIPPPKMAPSEPQLSFFERHPDMEKFIGENLVNKIGIAILVLAIGFFVKYAIDNNWVGPAGRVAIGILCGGILVGIAHRLRKSYTAFSSVLVGGGLAVFYFTITLAFHQFHLFSQTISFIILIVITCFAVALSILYDRQELAVIALVGGMSSPFMVSTGNANYNALFTYFIILNTGLLIIAYYKAWRILNISAFGLTVLVLAGVIYTLPDKAAGISFIYISVLYLLFFLVNIANNIKENKAFIASDFTILLVNTALYFSSGLYLLTLMHDEQLRGIFCASIGALNLLFSFVLFRTKKAEINILYLLIGITLTFLSLTAPIQLHGHFITLFWAAESVLIYWLYTKSNIRIMQWASMIIWVAMLCSLMMDWFNLYGSPENGLTIIANKGFITTLFSAICSFLLALLIDKTEAGKRILPQVVFKCIAFILLFLAGMLEVNHQFLNRYPGTELNFLYLMLYLPAFVYIFMWITGRWKTLQLNGQTEVAILSLTIISYLFCTQQFFDVQAGILVDHKIASAHFVAHWVGVLFIILIFYRLIVLCRNELQAIIKPVSWVLSGVLVLFFSLEICLLSNMIFYTQGADMDHIEIIYIKTGLPVLWGISSFVLMWLGMHYKTRVLRIISLTLFSITLIKLFVYDIEHIPAGGKIAAFFCLGVLLLIISFMYQKVKNIITDDKDTPKN